MINDFYSNKTKVILNTLMDLGYSNYMLTAKDCTKNKDIDKIINNYRKLIIEESCKDMSSIELIITYADMMQHYYNLQDKYNRFCECYRTKLFKNIQHYNRRINNYRFHYNIEVIYFH